jgi:hypothetical protein
VQDLVTLKRFEDESVSTKEVQEMQKANAVFVVLLAHIPGLVFMAYIDWGWASVTAATLFAGATCGLIASTRTSRITILFDRSDIDEGRGVASALTSHEGETGSTLTGNSRPKQGEVAVEKKEEEVEV